MPFIRSRSPFFANVGRLRRCLLVAQIASLCLRIGCVYAQKPSASANAQTANSPFAAAEALLAQGRIAEAKENIQEQLKLNPRNIDGYNLLGIACTHDKDYSGALNAFETALKLNPASTETHNNLGNLYVAEQRLDLAEKEFRKVLSLSPSNSDANYNLGLLLMAKGSPSSAIAHLERVHPAAPNTRLNLIRAYLRAGRTAEALKRATQMSAEAKDNVQLHFTLGVLLASEKQYKPAQLELEKANVLQPDTFEILYNLGQACLRSGDYEKAELYLNRALERKSDSPDALYLLAQMYSQQGRPVDALDLLVRARKLAPENVDIIFLMARISMTQNYFEDAIPLLESGLQIAPKRADLHAALGESYFMSGKEDKAIEEFKNLIELDPSARSYTFMGLSFRHLGRFDEAKKWFEEGLKKDPRDASCLFNLGFIQERQGNYASAEELFEQALRSNSNFSDALLELANLKTRDQKFSEALPLLKKYVKVSSEPAAGYYRLAMVERGLHDMPAAERDLKVFQTLSKDASLGPYPYQHLFDYLDNRSKLSAEQRTELDITELTQQIQKHPGQQQDIYLLAETYLKLGKVDEARKAIAQLDEISAGDYRTQTGVGVLLARHRLYADAVQHFQMALRASPDSDDVKFDLADAYFHQGLYPDALAAAEAVSDAGRDDAYLALLGDIYAHLGDTAKATDILRQSILRNPDNDQNYLSLTLVQTRENDIPGAEQTLQKGLARIPNSGKLLWGLGVLSVLRGNTAQAAQRLERALDLMPEWPGSYSTLGVFYYQTGQFDKAREVLNRFKGSNAGGLDVSRIEDVLARAPADSRATAEPMSAAARQQFLQLALTIADRTL